MERNVFLSSMAFRDPGTLTVASSALAASSAHQNDHDIGEFLSVHPFAQFECNFASDIAERPIRDVRITFTPLSFGPAGEAAPGRSGEFSTNLPSGHITVTPSQNGCSFTPGPLSTDISGPGCFDPRYAVNSTGGWK